MIDLVDDKYAITVSLDGLPHDLLTVPVGVAGGSINEIEAGVESTPEGRDQLRPRHPAVSEVPDAEDGRHKTSAS
jgi:hypothetical protein